MGVGSPESVPDAPSGAGLGYFSGQAEVDPFAECDSKIGEAGVTAGYTQYKQAGTGWIADAFSKPSNSEYRTIANFGKVENGKYWTLLGGGCGGNTVSGGFCITWTDEVKDEILSWTKEDMVNPNDPAKGLWDGILLDFEYTVWGKDAGTNLKEIAAHLKGLGVAVGLSAPGYGPKKGASCPDGLTPPCKEPYTPFGITCTAAGASRMMLASPIQFAQSMWRALAPTRTGLSGPSSANHSPPRRQGGPETLSFTARPPSARLRPAPRGLASRW